MMEIIYAYEFSRGAIVEIKNTNLPITAPKEERFCWSLCIDGVKSVLEFESRTETTRKFKNGLELDILNLKMVYQGITYDIINIKEDGENKIWAL